MTGSMEQQWNNYSFEMDDNFEFQLESLCGFKIVNFLSDDMNSAWMLPN